MKLQYENICVCLGGREILKGVTLAAGEGELTGSSVPTAAESPPW